MDKRKRGEHFERIARNYLEAHKLVFITANFHCRWGEIDLVMQEKTSLVFVEVRFRSRSSYLSGAISIDAKKQRKLCKAAMYYLAAKAPANTPARFDVVSISRDKNKQTKLEWLKNAFECNIH